MREHPAALRIDALRKNMAERGIDAYIVTSADAHASEYTASFWHVRQWLSGFTGSAGLLVVTPDSAGLWTDGRYFIQAEMQLEGSGIELFRELEPGVPAYTKFLADNLPNGGKLGFDGRTVMVAEFKKIEAALSGKNISFAYDEDIEIWADRPPLPTGAAFAHPPEFACHTSAEKLAAVRAKMREKNIGAYLVTALESTAWLANLRGGDIPNTPVVYAFTLITPAEAHIFIHKEKISPEMLPDFKIHEYDALPKFLESAGKVHFNPQNTNVTLAEAMEKAELADDIILGLKATKSEAELANIKNAYLREGVVMVKMLTWLHSEMAKGTELYEGDVVRFLRETRKAIGATTRTNGGAPLAIGATPRANGEAVMSEKGGHPPSSPRRGEEEKSAFPTGNYYLSDSFDTICAYGANAAMSHYNCGERGAKLEPHGFLLIDTGGQYLDGTTDTTRTICLGEITSEMKRDFTLVLKGNMNLTAAVFPSGTTGSALDVLARTALWESGQNYRHGTGHGIGYCLSVHEGPHRIAPIANPIALAPGMLISNEPGVYKQDRYGIRTENIMYVQEKQTTPDGTFLSFETLTLCPMDTQAIDAELLTPQERANLNAYHKQTREALSPYLPPQERAWLTQSTLPI